MTFLNFNPIDGHFGLPGYTDPDPIAKFIVSELNGGYS